MEARIGAFYKKGIGLRLMKSINYSRPEVNFMVCIIIIMVSYKGHEVSYWRHHPISLGPFIRPCCVVRSRVELLSEWLAGIGMSSAMGMIIISGMEKW